GLRIIGRGEPVSSPWPPPPGGCAYISGKARHPPTSTAIRAGGRSSPSMNVEKTSANTCTAQSIDRVLNQSQVVSERPLVLPSTKHSGPVGGATSATTNASFQQLREISSAARS